MRILQVCQPAEGGVARSVLTLSKELKARGWPVDVACSPGPLAEELRGAGISVFPLPLVRAISPRRDLAATLRLYKLIRRGKYSLVHAHSAKAGVVGRVAAWTARTPVVFTPQAWSFLVARSKYERGAYVWVERALALLTNRIICVSSNELELGRNCLWGVEDRLRLVPNGVTPPAEKRGREGGLVVGTVARLARQKGIEYLVLAAEQVCAKRSGVRFSVAGDGPNMDPLNKEIERRGLRDKFELLGEISGIWEYLEGIDVFVLPSLWEGMPFALVDAMGFGLPVVATDVGGIRDLIPDANFGMVVPPADPHALRDSILRYVDSPRLRKTVGTLARMRVLQEFSTEQMIEGTLGVYSEILFGHSTIRGFKAHDLERY